MFHRAEELFLKIFKDRTVDSIEEIPRGYSNKTFKLNSGKEVFRVRIACNNNIIDRNNEYLILRAIDDMGCLFYDRSSGDGIWKWIEGDNLTKDQLNLSVLLKINKEIKKIHSISPDKICGILNHDDFEFLESTKNYLDAEIVDLYKYLINKNKFDQRVLCHNDVSMSNLIYNSSEDKIYLIDYEWGRVNSPYWDYGNFVKESDLDIGFVKHLSDVANLDFYKLLEYCFIASVYSFQLSYSFPETNSLQTYRDRVRNLIFKYKRWLER